MSFPHRSPSPSGILGGWRLAGPLGLDALPEQKVVEQFNRDLNEWTAVPDTQSTVFVRRAKEGTTPDRRVHTNFDIEEKTIAELGTTNSRLFVEIIITTLPSGRYEAAIARAELDVTITVLPKGRFDKLTDFKPLYEAFQQILKTKDREAAILEFAGRHIKISKDGHPRADYTGIRAAAVQHEVGHARHAVRQTSDTFDNLIAALNKDGKSKSSLEAGRRVKSIVNSHFRGWGFDVGQVEHRRIYEHDCRFMITLYEITILRDVLAMTKLPLVVNPMTFKLMEELGEPYPWKD